MNYSKIAIRYAKAVFLLADEKNLLKEIASDMESILTIEKEVPALLDLYHNPVLSSSEKKKVVLEIFKNSFNEVSLNFLELIIDNRREAHISGVARNFLKRYKDHQGIKKAILTTAGGIDEAKREEIRLIVKANYNAEVEMESKENPELVGGFILQVDDTQFDASIATQLKNIKHELLS